MAEILCINYSNHNSKAAINGMCYKRGMCVLIKKDGWAWNANELSDSYFIISIPGIEPDNTFLNNLLILANNGLERRQFIINIDDFTQEDHDFLADEKNNDTERIANLFGHSYEIV